MSLTNKSIAKLILCGYVSITLEKKFEITDKLKNFITNIFSLINDCYNNVSCNIKKPNKEFSLFFFSILYFAIGHMFGQQYESRKLKSKLTKLLVPGNTVKICLGYHGLKFVEVLTKKKYDTNMRIKQLMSPLAKHK